MFCITDIYHPNIDTSDMFSTSDPNVCLNLLDSRKWSRKFGLEAAVLGLVFLLHNPNLSDPLFSDIERDKETFEKNVKKYMRGEDVDGRSFAADFLNDLQAQNTKNESTDKIVEPSNSVYYTNENDVTEIQSIDGINNSNGDNEANTLLEQLKQLGIETVDDNVAGACALVALDNDTVLVPYESTEIIKDLKSTSEMKQHCDLAVKID